MAHKMSFEMLRRQDDLTSQEVIERLKSSEKFKFLSVFEGNEIIKRDREDEGKLAAGIDISIKKGALMPLVTVPSALKINVVGKPADVVAQEILSHLPGKTGNVLILQGLSGTGKGTTVKKLQSALSSCVCWSNGNVFRSLTHLLSAHCDEHKIDFQTALKDGPLLAALMGRLSFKKFGEHDFDVVIDGVTRVSTIQNTLLKMPHIGSRVPSVAEQAQGEVIKFAASAVKVLQDDGCNVILEGRAQTLNYIPTTQRFELVIPDTSVLGQRRAAQRVMALALTKINESATEEEVSRAVELAVEAL